MHELYKTTVVSCVSISRTTAWPVLGSMCPQEIRVLLLETLSLWLTMPTNHQKAFYISILIIFLKNHWSRTHLYSVWTHHLTHFLFLSSVCYFHVWKNYETKKLYLKSNGIILFFSLISSLFLLIALQCIVILTSLEKRCSCTCSTYNDNCIWLAQSTYTFQRYYITIIVVV